MIRRQFMKTALAAGLTSAAVPAAAGAARPGSGASGHERAGDVVELLE